MKVCSVPGCLEKHKAKGYCRKHYDQFRNHNRILNENEERKQNKHNKNKEFCKVKGCDTVACSLGFCKKHYDQFRSGKTPTLRTKNDLNEIIEYEDYAEIILYDRDQNEKARTLIDLEDIERCKDIKWGYSSGYVDSSIGRLHRYIMNCPNDLVVDHINHNTLDNRKENLRICTIQENSCNRKLGKNNKTGKVGIFQLQNKKWQALLTYQGISHNLGIFDTKEDAIKARQQAERDYFGEFSNERSD